MRITSAAAKTTKSTRSPRARNILKSRRETVLDVWRGLAVLLMMITHAIAFFHVGDNAITNTIGTFGGLASFTLFLFISGASAYFAYIKYEGDKHSVQIAKRRSKILMRTLFILLGYYIVALVASIPELAFPPDQRTWDTVIGVLTLQVVPPFAEFILAFVLFNVVLLIARPAYNMLSKFPISLIIIGLTLYAIGHLLYLELQVPEVLISYKGLLVGHEQLHYFPVLQFSIVYFLGIIFGKFLFDHQSNSLRKQTAFYAIIATALLVFAGTVSSGYLDIDVLQPLLRWPPALTMIAVGLLSGYVVWLFLLLTNNGKILGPLQVITHYMGTKAFDFFVIHTILLFGYKYISGDQHHESLLVVSGLFLLLITLTVVLTALLENVIASLKEASDSETEFGWLVSERVIVNGIWVSLIVVVGLSLFQGQVRAEDITPEEVSFKKVLLREQSWPFWWDNSYYGFRQITIENQGALAVSPDTWYQVGLNHKSLVNNNRSSQSGGDVRIVYYDEANDYFYELPFDFSGVNTNNAVLKFQTQTSIPVGESDDRYFVYFGNPDVDKLTPADGVPSEATSQGVVVSDTFTHQLNGSVNKRWHLKEGISALQLRTVKYTVNLDSDLSADSVVTYNILGTDVRGTMDNLGNRKYEAAVPIGDLDAGIYTIRSTARQPDDRLNLISSGNTNFFVTYPLYVVWTQDWEGNKVADFSWLDSLDRMAKKYDMPMTHFFNPRIYVDNEISSDLADRYTLWVQNRAKEENDEIGLHIHMWTDMVQAAGVTPRYSPVSPWLGGAGYGTLTSAYTKGEMKKILNWAKTTFQSNGLLAPISYRAGGWFTEEHTLQALAETGFLIDSSGRTKPRHPRQVAYPPPWDLKVTTRPYMPNVNNQNSEAEPHINIWEFPNNGADSYWYNAQELIDRFHANYPNKGEILDKPQVLNYLSHPQFFKVFHEGGTDETKMTAVFDITNRFLHSKDKGPVVYTTLENAYYGYTPWAKEQTKIN